jgi:protein O-mannosyl-transferase
MARVPIRHELVRPSLGIQRAVLGFILVALTLTVYAPVKQHPFIHIDDYGYVVNNFHIQHLSWDTVTWSFTTFHYSNWDPLTWLSHALDCHFFGLDAGRHHEMNLLLHALSALLLFWLLSQATGYVGRSFAVAALFALHPVNVEPVAWVAERKTVLSMVFFLLTLMAYRCYASHPAVHRYLVVAILFACGLMSKPQVITLPFVLLLWDYWPLERITFRERDAVRHSLFAIRQASAANESGEERMANGEERSSGEKPFLWLVAEKVPLLALSAASALLTMKAQWVNGTLGGLNSYPFSMRLSGSIIGYVRYFSHALWPANLSFFYPHAHTSPPLWQTACATILLLLITCLALAARNHRYLAVGWLWFLGTLVPMIQLVQVGNHAMADRYAYLPFIGLFIAICWGVADWAERWSVSRILLPAGTVAILLLMSFATRRQLSYWTDDLTLWTHSSEAVKNNAMAEELIGETLLEKHDSDRAIAHFRAAESMDPLFPFPYLHVGTYEEDHGQPRLALEQFQKVIDLTDSAADRMPALRTSAFAHMSFAYNKLGDYANQQKYLTMAAQQHESEVYTPLPPRAAKP